jgi:hypothetical protein
MGVSDNTNVASAGTETVFAMYTVALAPVADSPVAPAVVKPSTYKLTSAAFVPSTLATVILFIFKIFSASTVH